MEIPSNEDRIEKEKEEQEGKEREKRGRGEDNKEPTGLYQLNALINQILQFNQEPGVSLD